MSFKYNGIMCGALHWLNFAKDKYQQQEKKYLKHEEEGGFVGVLIANDYFQKQSLLAFN